MMGIVMRARSAAYAEVVLDGAIRASLAIGLIWGCVTIALEGAAMWFVVVMVVVTVLLALEIVDVLLARRRYPVSLTDARAWRELDRCIAAYPDGTVRQIAYGGILVIHRRRVAKFLETRAVERVVWDRSGDPPMLCGRRYVLVAGNRVRRNFFGGLLWGHGAPNTMEPAALSRRQRRRWRRWRDKTAVLWADQDEVLMLAAELRTSRRMRVAN